MGREGGGGLRWACAGEAPTGLRATVEDGRSTGSRLPPHPPVPREVLGQAEPLLHKVDGDLRSPASGCDRRCGGAWILTSFTARRQYVSGSVAKHSNIINQLRRKPAASSRDEASRIRGAVPVAIIAVIACHSYSCIYIYIYIYVYT